MFDSVLLAVQIFASCLAVISAWYGDVPKILQFVWPVGCLLWALAWFKRGLRRW